MENPNILLDFELSDEQLEMLKIHGNLKSNGALDDLKYFLEENKDENYDKVQIWFDCSYNDNTYDVRAIYADIIKEDKIVKKIKLHTWKEIDISTWDKEEDYMYSYTITPKMIL